MSRTHECTYCRYYGNEYKGTYREVLIHADKHPIGHPTDMVVKA